MTTFTVLGTIDPLLQADLKRGDAIAAESNAMVAMDETLTLSGTARGGLMKSFARKFLNEESFFQQRIEAERGAGRVLLAANLPGDIRVIDVGRRVQFLLTDGSYLASTDGVTLKTRTQGIGRALLGDSGGLFIMGTEGEGQIAVSGFGSIAEMTVTPEKPLIVDNGHVVAWEQSLDYELSLSTGRSGFFGKVVGSQMTGEGIVLRFTGSGRVLMCSRNRGGFIAWITKHLPLPKQN